MILFNTDNSRGCCGLRKLVAGAQRLWTHCRADKWTRLLITNLPAAATAVLRLLPRWTQTPHSTATVSSINKSEPLVAKRLFSRDRWRRQRPQAPSCGSLPVHLLTLSGPHYAHTVPCVFMLLLCSYVSCPVKITHVINFGLLLHYLAC